MESAINPMTEEGTSPDFSSVSIALASPEDIRSWSYGEVKKPETINYRTYRAEKDGLFCERIFGPERDWECFCGKYKGMKHKGIICDRCGVKVTHSRERRKRMGHINLAAPVVHIWFFKAMPSRLGALLAMKTTDLEKVVYFQEYVVVDPGPAAAEGVRERDLLTEERFRKLKETYGDAFVAGMGAEALRDIVKTLDLDKISKELRVELTETGSKQRKTDIVKRLKLVEAIKDSPNKPEWVIMDVIPVIPPDLRPLVLLESGNFATSDLNDLYRRVINRNNRLKKLQDLHAPEVIIRNEKRMLQQAVDALFDNDRTKRPVLGSSNRPLKSLTDMIKGKQGRFRENLLGKRVDYSARSVIVVGPELKLHQCGLPKKIALELFQPFIIRRLKELGYVDTIKSAKKMLERKDEEVWDILDEVIREHPVLLNRAPTLHRMGIQAFEPILVEGNAIRIHPLVCEAFNADFDGDQMAVHLPLSIEAQAEASILMMSTNNIFSPADGNPIIRPSLDMVLGCYYLTVMVEPKDQVRTMVFSDTTEALLAFEEGRIKCQQPIEVRLDAGRALVDETGKRELPANRRIRTTAGRVHLNEVIPQGMPFYNLALDKSTINRIINDTHQFLGRSETIQLLDSIKELGFKQATLGGLSIASEDLRMPADKYDIIERATQEVERIEKNYRRGLITDSERHHQVTETWTHASNAVADQVMVELKRPESGYARLEEFLHKLRLEGETTYDLSLAEAQKQVGEPLPMSAEKTPGYWQDTSRNPLGSAITKAGWKAVKVTQASGKVTGAHLTLRGRGKYTLLQDYLSKQKRTQPLEITVRQIEQIVEDTIPQMALTEDNYWRNTTHNPLGAAIARSGWRVATLQTADGRITGAMLEPVTRETFAAIRDFLAELKLTGATHVLVTTKQLEEKIGGPLPETAAKQPNDWFDSSNNALGVAILRSGWRVAKLDRTPSGKITGAHLEAGSRINPIWCMYASGAKGTAMQIRQMAGMRGLMSKPSGEIIETPIKANFREGLPVLEYFSSTHGGRKGLADTALKTAESGYLTRKLADVAQHVVITMNDCATANGVTKTVIYAGDRVEVSLAKAIFGRTAAETVKDRRTGKVIVEDGGLITSEIATAIETMGYDSMKVRSAMTCEAPFGICAKCYGMDLSTRQLVEEGLAVGIIAAQSIGEPGTQLTMRTFHIGGIATTKGGASADIRAAEAGIVTLDNVVTAPDPESETSLIVLNQNGELILRDENNRELRRHQLRIGAKLMVKDGAKVPSGKILASWDPHMVPIIAEKNGVVRYVDIIEDETMRLEVDTGGTERHVIIEHKGDLHPQIMIVKPRSSRDGSSIEIGEHEEELKKNVKDIVDWKRVVDPRGLERARADIDDNDPNKIWRILKNTWRLLKQRKIEDAYKEIAAEEFKGVGDNGPVASAILRFLAPDACAIVDRVVWNALCGRLNPKEDKKEDATPQYTARQYGKYIAFLTETAASLNKKGVPKHPLYRGKRDVWGPADVEVAIWGAIQPDKSKSVDDIDFSAAPHDSFEKKHEIFEKAVAAGKELVKLLESDSESEGEILGVYSIPEKAYIGVKENEHVKAGTVLARTPRQIGRTQDITAGLPRVTELFEARKPKDPAIISEISGIVHLGERKRGRRSIIVRNEEADMEREHLVPQGKRLLVTTGSLVREGDPLVDGPLVPHDILRIKGEEALQQYLLQEVQSVYRFCGEEINDKHIEVMIAQMIRKVHVGEDVGDTDLLPGSIIDKFQFRAENERVAAKSGKTASAASLLLGITKAALRSESFISAASFQETTKVLTEAALAGKRDNLLGLKENVILGHMIPAGTGFAKYKSLIAQKLQLPAGSTAAGE